MHFFDTYTAELSAALDGVSRDAFDALIEVIKLVQANDGFVYTCGNGGSAATASHMVNDLVKAPADATGCRPIRAVSLTDCVPLMTALANDIEIEHACEMSCACTTCHVIVREGYDSLEEADELEDDYLDKAWGLEPESRLSCQAIVADEDLVIEIPRYTINMVSERH